MNLLDHTPVNSEDSREEEPDWREADSVMHAIAYHKLLSYGFSIRIPLHSGTQIPLRSTALIRGGMLFSTKLM